MLSRLRKRSPLVFRVFLTAVSAVGAVCVASAFTFAPAHPAKTAAPPVYPAAQYPNPARVTTFEGYTHHEWHAMHESHLARLAYLTEEVAQERYAAAHPVPVRRTYVPSTVAPSHSASVQEDARTISTAGDSGFQACVIRAESGGNPQVMNSTGHYGLYQFSEETWTGHGGSAADFGHASVAEQNQVFANTVAADGVSDWAPYDGC
jgi:hypothetical protein